MTKIVINECYGGFGLSEQAIRRYAELTGKPFDEVRKRISAVDRNDPALVQVVEELGEAADGFCAKLAIEELPPGTLYRIDEYDGLETIVRGDEQVWLIA